MRMKYGIGFFGVMIMALTLMAGAYQLSFKKAQERAANVEIAWRSRCRQHKRLGQRGARRKTLLP